MVTNTVELEVMIVRAGLTKREVARRLGLSEMGLYKKINNITEFKASEIQALVVMLDIQDIGKIFFNKNVDLNSTKRRIYERFKDFQQ